MRDDIALEGADPKCIKKFRLVGFPVGAATAIFLVIGAVHAPNSNLQALSAIILIAGAIFSVVEGAETDLWKFPRPSPVRGGFLSGFLLVVLFFLLFSVMRYVNGP